jgi:D-sedoheptulose 7-phosphate isomerase
MANRSLAGVTIMAQDEWADEYLGQSAAAMQTLASDAGLRATMMAMAERITAALRAGNKLLLAGNGGSAADAQHIAAEFTGRLMFDRPPLAAIALTTDSSALTAIANDYGFSSVFERQVRALGRPGDVLFAISTSGRSPNILEALDSARAAGMVTLGFCGADEAPMADHADLVFTAPSPRTAIVQQIHITALHLITGIVERELYPELAP